MLHDLEQPVVKRSGDEQENETRGDEDWVCTTVEDHGVGIPTEWNKAAYDAMDQAYQAERGMINEQIGAMMRSGADEAAISALKEKGERLSWEHQQAVDAWFASNPAAGKVGAFEGAGYEAKGLYRPEVDCIMFTRNPENFCRVCSAALERMIDLYSE